MTISPTDRLPRVAEWPAPAPEAFHDEIVARGRPAVLRGIAALADPRRSMALHAAHTAEQAELSPGDGIFIPRDWFHHLEALERFNILVNYWWDAGGDRARERNRS